MIGDNALSRVVLLVQHKKYAEAERLLKDMLSATPENATLLSLLAEVFLQQDQYENAERVIDNAIALDPGNPHGFYVKSRIAVQLDKWDNALAFIHRAIDLDAYDPDYHAFLANILLARKQFTAALESANTALELNPEHLLGLNTRSTALLKLNRKEESFSTIEDALRGDPNNAYTHANYGWGLLEKGDHRKAMTHFKEALQANPESTYAQSGLLQALKATNPLYRGYLKYSFFMGNLTKKYKWVVIIGLYLLVRGLEVIAKSNEALLPYLMPVIVLFGLFAFSTWVMNPLGNLFLRLNKFGALLLSREEKLSSTFVGVSLMISVAGLVAWFITRNEVYLAIVAFGFLMMVPLGAVYTRQARYKYLFPVYTVVLALVGIASIGYAFIYGELMNNIAIAFFIGFVGFQWVSNLVRIKD